MNEELQKALGELLSKANNGIDAASGFLVAELPEVIQQLLMWNMFHSVTWGVLLLGGFLFSVWATIKLTKWVLSEVGEALPVLIFPIAGCVVLALKSIDYLFIALQIYIAPKVWLLEYAASLAK